MAAAGRESARLVSAYVVGRDLDGALAALEEAPARAPGRAVAHAQPPNAGSTSGKGVAAREAADLYHKAIQAWPTTLAAQASSHTGG